MPNENGAFLGPRKFAIASDGIRIIREGAETALAWHAVQGLTTTPLYLFIWTDRLASYQIPVRDLPPDCSAAGLAAQLRLWIDAAKSEQPSSDAAARGADSDSSTATTISMLLRFSILRPIQNLSFRTTDWKIAAVAALVLVEFSILDRLAVGPGAQLTTIGIPGIAAFVLAGLCVTWLLSRLNRPSIEFKDALLPVLGCSVIAIGLSAFIDAYVQPGSQYLARWILLLYSVAYFRVALKSLAGAAQPAALLSAGLVIAGFHWLSEGIYLSPTLWIEPQDDSVAAWRETARRSEELLFGQSAAIDAQLSHMTTGGADAKVYFVGFAGVGEQKVFAEEIHLAQQRIDDRYATGDRAVLLLNDVRDLDQNPLATVSGLRRTLAGIGSKMDHDRDVLFLALSSHGSAKPELSVSNGSLPLSELSGEQLKQALADSGIQWRVIVISACHAGAFIPALRDDHTIVITAAAAERTSFGCSNDRDLTYFGEAFYRDALPHAKTLRDAFEKAKAAIAQREDAEKLTPSDPTAFFGAAIEEKLAGIEANRQTAGSRLRDVEPMYEQSKSQ
jgi:hypothetical protein